MGGGRAIKLPKKGVRPYIFAFFRFFDAQLKDDESSTDVWDLQEFQIPKVCKCRPTRIMTLYFLPLCS